MGFHHVALATRDLAATHDFYTSAMGFELVKVVAAATPEGTGWSKHAFYDTGRGSLMAFWELHDDAIGDTFPTAVSTGIGLPVWVNHLAFEAPTVEDLEHARRRWQEHGITVVEVDHEFCTSIYATDPNGIMVEYCHSTRPFDDTDLQQAHERLLAERPALDPAPPMRVHKPLAAAGEAVGGGE